MKSTHTFATLQISNWAYAEIEMQLRAAGYHHAFIKQDGRTIIDLNGIGVFTDPALRDAPKEDQAVEMLLRGVPPAGGSVNRKTLEKIVRAAFRGGVAANFNVVLAATSDLN